MSLLRRQLRTANARIDACRNLALNIGHADSDNLHLGWLKEDLAKAKSSLERIDIEIVEVFRRQGRSTENVLDEHVSRAEDTFQTSVSGIFACVDELSDHFSVKRDTAAVLTLEKIRKLARKTLKTLYLITRPKLAFLLSWRCLFLIIGCGLIATCLLYVSHYAIHPQRGQTPAQSVANSATSDVKRIHEVASDSDVSFMDRILTTVTTIVDLLPKVPQAILAITAAIAALQGLMAALVKPSKRK
jgi:hypothetical protein